MRALTLDELRELAPAFVMGTLTGEELEQFNAALRDAGIAAELAPEIAAHRAAAEFIAASQPVTPPPALRQRLEARIASERAADGGLASLRMAETAELPASPVEPVVRRATRATPPRPPAVARRTSSTAAWTMAGVMGLAMAASAFFAVRLNTRVTQLETELAVRERVVQRIAERLASRDSTVAALTSADNDMVLVRLAANEANVRSMQVYWNTRTGQAVVHATGFAPVPKDRTYCLWVIHNGKPEAVALFTPDADGQRLLNAVNVPRDAAGIAAFAVTEEPAGGSPQPTMTPFLVGAVPTR